MASDFEKDVRPDDEFWQDDEKYKRPSWLGAGDSPSDGPDSPDGDADSGVDADADSAEADAAAADAAAAANSQGQAAAAEAAAEADAAAADAAAAANSQGQAAAAESANAAAAAESANAAAAAESANAAAAAEAANAAAAAESANAAAAAESANAAAAAEAANAAAAAESANAAAAAESANAANEVIATPAVVETPAIVETPAAAVESLPTAAEAPTVDHTYTTPVVELTPVAVDTHSAETTTHTPITVAPEAPTAVDNSHPATTTSEPTYQAPETVAYKAGGSGSDSGQAGSNIQGGHQSGHASTAESQSADQQNQTETVYQADHEQGHSQTSAADRGGNLDRPDNAGAQTGGSVDLTDHSSTGEGSSHQAILTGQADQAGNASLQQAAIEHDQLGLDSADLHSAIESLAHAEVSPAIAISTAALVSQLFKGEADHSKDTQKGLTIEAQGADGRTNQAAKSTTTESNALNHAQADSGSLAMAAFAELPMSTIWLSEHEDLTGAIVAADSIRIFASAAEIIKKKSMSQQTSEKLNQFSQNIGKLAGAALTAARKGIVGFY